MIVHLNLLYVHLLQIWPNLIYAILVIVIIVLSEYQSSAWQNVPIKF